MKIIEFLSIKQDLRKVIADSRARYFGAELNDQSLIPADNPRLGQLRFEEWMQRMESIPPNMDASDTKLVIGKD